MWGEYSVMYLEIRIKECLLETAEMYLGKESATLIKKIAGTLVLRTNICRTHFAEKRLN